MEETPETGGGKTPFSSVQLVGRGAVALGLAGTIYVGIKSINAVKNSLKSAHERAHTFRDLSQAFGQVMHAEHEAGQADGQSPEDSQQHPIDI